ncbi:MAG: ComEC/Rec2 family competence protein [Candidatus Doudnabacteria bacterium]
MTKVHFSQIIKWLSWVFLLIVVLRYYLGGFDQQNIYQPLLGQQIDTEGVVVREPQYTSGGSQLVTVRPDGINQNLQASFYKPIVVERGDRVWIRGRVEPIANFSDFDYQSYLARYQTYALLKKPQIIRIGFSQVQWRRDLNLIKQKILFQAQRSLSQPAQSLILGMLIGETRGMPQDLENNFKLTGLTHILVVSGFNMTIVATSFGWLAWILGRKSADLAAILAVIVFACLTGLSAAVVRAAIMAVIYLVARLFNRPSYSFNALLISVVVMVGINPLILFVDVGFRLSVAATIGVLWAHRLRAQYQKTGWLSELLWPTFGAIIMTLPIIAWYFGTTSLVAPLANLLILPLVPWLMLFGAISLVPIVGWVLIPLVNFLIVTEVKIIGWLAHLPYASIYWQPKLWIILIWYLLVIMIKNRVFRNPKIYQNTSKTPLLERSPYDKMKKIII